MMNLIRPHQKLTMTCLVPPNPRLERYRIGPFDKGAGLTYVNDLRVMMVGFLASTHIVGAQYLDGESPFSLSPGIKEDGLEVLLSLGSIPLRSEYALHLTTRPGLRQCSGRLKMKGPGLVTAACLDLPAGITPVDPSLHIASLGPDRSIDIEVHIQVCNQCVVPSSVLKNSEVATHSLLFESISLPVESFCFELEKTNTPDTDLEEYYCIEVATNGSLFPSEALYLAAKDLASVQYEMAGGFLEITQANRKVLLQQLQESVPPPSFFLEREEEGELYEEEEYRRRLQILNTQEIESLKVPKHLIKLLKANGKHRLGDLLDATTLKELEKMKGLGLKSISDILFQLVVLLFSLPLSFPLSQTFFQRWEASRAHSRLFPKEVYEVWKKKRGKKITNSKFTDPEPKVLRVKDLLFPIFVGSLFASKDLPEEA